MNRKKLIKELKKKLRKDPQNEPVRLQLARVYAETDQVADAVNAYLSLGYELYEQKQLQRAQEMAKLALALNPEHKRARELLQVASLDRSVGRAASEVDARAADGNWVPSLAGQRAITGSDSEVDGRAGTTQSDTGEARVATADKRGQPGRRFASDGCASSPMGPISADDSAAILMTPTPLPLPLSEHDADERDSIAHIDIKRYSLPLNIEPSGPLPRVSLPDGVAPLDDAPAIEDDDLLAGDTSASLPVVDASASNTPHSATRIVDVSALTQGHAGGLRSIGDDEDDEPTNLGDNPKNRLRNPIDELDGHMDLSSGIPGPALDPQSEQPAVISSVKRPGSSAQESERLSSAAFEDDEPTALTPVASIDEAIKQNLSIGDSTDHRITLERDTPLSRAHDGDRVPTLSGEAADAQPADTRTDIPQVTNDPFALWSDDETRDTARKLQPISATEEDHDTSRYAARQAMDAIPDGSVADDERTVRVAFKEVDGFAQDEFGLSGPLSDHDDMADQLDGLPMVIHDEDDMGVAFAPAQVEPEPEPARDPLAAFAELPGEALNELSSRVTLRHYGAETFILRQDERAEACFSLVSGRVVCVRYDPDEHDSEYQETARLGGGDLFGESSLLPARRFRASVRVLEDCSAYEIPRRTLRELAALYPGVDSALAQVYRDRLLDSLIAIHPFLRGLKRQKQLELRNRFQALTFESGQSLMREGEPSGGLYLVVAGALEVTKRLSRKRAVLLATLEEGSFLSDMSSLRNAPSCVTVSAVGPVELAVLPAKPFKRVLDMTPELWTAILDERGRRTLERNHILTGSSVMV